MTAKSKIKGNAGERELCKLLSEILFEVLFAFRTVVPMLEAKMFIVGLHSALLKIVLFVGALFRPITSRN